MKIFFKVLQIITATASIISCTGYENDVNASAEKTEFATWVKVSEIDSLIKKKNPRIIDIRTRQEYQRGYIKGAVNIPLDQLEYNLDSLNKKRPVLIYCNTINRVRYSLQIFKTKGFVKVFLIYGGYVALNNEGYPLIRPDYRH